MADSDDLFDYRLELDGTEARFCLIGDLDFAASSILDGAVGELATDGVQTLIFDCTDLGFIDSGGIRSFIRAQALFASAGRTVTVVNLPRPAVTMLAMYGVLELLGGSANDPLPPIATSRPLDGAADGVG